MDESSGAPEIVNELVHKIFKIERESERGAPDSLCVWHVAFKADTQDRYLFMPQHAMQRDRERDRERE